MSHAYPIAPDALTALNEAELAARTRYEAEEAAPDSHIDSLATEWLTPSPAEIEAWLQRVQEGPGHGFVQQYEDAAGQPVFAITYWKMVQAKGTEAKALPPEPITSGVEDAEADDTDDLYFKQKKKRGRQKPVDKNQLDLFAAPKADDA